MINRDEAIVLLKKYLRDEDNIKYSQVLEIVLQEIAQKLERNKELWGLTGLLHNLDYEYTRSEPENRGTLSAQILEELLPNRCVNAIKANNYMHTDYIPSTALDKSLIAADTATRLILVIARTTPTKKIANVDLNLILEKFNDSSFGAKYNRNKIQLCQDIGIGLKNFLFLILSTLQENSAKLDI